MERTFGWADCSYTHHQKPHFYADLCEKVEQVWKDIDCVVEYCLNHKIPLPEELGEMRDEARELEHRKAQAWKAVCNGEEELEDIPF